MEETTEAEPNLVQRLDRWMRRSVKFYGALRRCSRSDWWRAVTELSITLIFGLLPIWVPVLVLIMFGSQGSFQDLVYQQTRSGELYLIATGLLAPIFYFTFPIGRPAHAQVKHFPSQQMIVLVFILTLIIAVVAIAAARMQYSTAGGMPVRMVRWSEWLFRFSCLMYLLTLVVKNWIEGGGVEEVFDAQSREQDRANPPPASDATPAAQEPDDLVASTMAAHEVPE